MRICVRALNIRIYSLLFFFSFYYYNTTILSATRKRHNKHRVIFYTYSYATAERKQVTFNLRFSALWANTMDVCIRNTDVLRIPAAARDGNDEISYSVLTLTIIYKFYIVRTAGLAENLSRKGSHYSLVPHVIPWCHFLSATILLFRLIHYTLYLSCYPITCMLKRRRMYKRRHSKARTRRNVRATDECIIILS